MKPKKTYKDSLFRSVFKNKKNLLSLYNALENTHYTNIEVYDMVSVEWNIDDAKKVWREEAYSDGMNAGLNKGISQGLSQGILVTAKKMLRNGLSVDIVVECTNLSLDKIKELSREITMEKQ